MRRSEERVLHRNQQRNASNAMCTSLLILRVPHCALLVALFAVPAAQAASLPTTLGWYQIPNSTLQAVCPPAAQYPDIQANEGCSGVVNDWRGGTSDTLRN